MSPAPTDPYNFANGATADAEQVDARFLALYSALNKAVTGLDALSIQDAAIISRLLKPTIDLKRATSNLTLAASYSPADVPGVTVTLTPDVASIMWVIWTSQIGPTSAPVSATTWLSVDGADLTTPPAAGPSSIVRHDRLGGDIPAALQGVGLAKISLNVSPHTVKMRAVNGAVGSTVELYAAGTAMLYLVTAA